MKSETTKEKAQQLHARSLLADIQRAPEIILPRRDTIVAWLDAYLLGKGEPADDDESTTGDDLAALDKFLRSHAVPVASQLAH